LPLTIMLKAMFAAAMARLGPFEPNPALAVAVSGGADSMALALLAADWVRQRDGATQAFVVDHGLRPASGVEAEVTIQRLARFGIPAKLLALTTLKPGSALAERARIMRYKVLSDACAQAGILHLLLGHHAADQVETLAMRVLRDSHTHGLAGMSALRETTVLRLLRPLLAIEPGLLRRFLMEYETVWVEDPSNQDVRAMRARLRQGFANPSGKGNDLLHALTSVGRRRCQEEAATADELARRVTIRPEGFALLSPNRIGVAALRSLIGTIGGARYLPGLGQTTELAAQPKPATLAGVRILPAGRFGDGLLIVREEAGIGDPVPALPDGIWDNRFRLIAPWDIPAGVMIGKLGSDAARFRARTDLPSAVLRTLPAVRMGKVLAAVPNLGYINPENDVRVTMLFSPRRPLAGSGFVPTS
jgi:tRNA(Ile)-lysidine synthase